MTRFPSSKLCLFDSAGTSRRCCRTLSIVVAFVLLCSNVGTAQTVTATRNANVYSQPSSGAEHIGRLLKGETAALLVPDDDSGYLRVRTSDGKVGYVWAKFTSISNAPAPHPPTPVQPSTAGPAPLVATNHAVQWWFVFKLNSKAFPACGQGASRSCPFGGDVQQWGSPFGQQYVFASSEQPALQSGSGCAGDTQDDPIGATFSEIYNGSLFYFTWNDQFYGDPPIAGCGDSCSSPWGHSKGIVAWNAAGDAVVMQVSTPDWPGSGSKDYPRAGGNTLGCTKADNDVEVSQHFFALKLTKADLIQLLTALQNASVVSDIKNPQVVRNGGPADVQALVNKLGVESSSHAVFKANLSSGVELISKPSDLNVPPWQMVSAILGGVGLRAATWWTKPAIPSTTSSSTISCWDSSLGTPGPVEIAMAGSWEGQNFSLQGGLGADRNHAKIAVSTTGTHHFAIFGDMNQQGALSGNCASSQNGRGGLFFVVENATLADSVGELITGNAAVASNSSQPQ